MWSERVSRLRIKKHHTISHDGDCSGIPYESDLRTGLQVHDSVGDGTWIPSAAAMDNSLTDNGFFHTDFLTLRFIDDDEAYLTSAMASAVANPVVSIVDQGVEDMEAGDLVAIHDCEKSTVFKVTGTAAVGGSTEIQHAVGADASDNATLALAQPEIELGAAISGIITRTYFVAPGAGENNQGDTPLSLWQAEFEFLYRVGGGCRKSADTPWCGCER